MTNLERLIKLFGSANTVAIAAGVSHQLVSRWGRAPKEEVGGKSGNIPSKYTRQILLWARENVPDNVRRDDWLLQVRGCLDDRCPHCGQVMLDL